MPHLSGTIDDLPDSRDIEPSRLAALLLSFSEFTTYLTLTYALQQESEAEEQRWLLALELHSYCIRSSYKNRLSPARRSNFHRKVVLCQRLLSSDLAAERSSASDAQPFPTNDLGGNPAMPRK